MCQEQCFRKIRGLLAALNLYALLRASPSLQFISDFLATTWLSIEPS